MFSKYAAPVAALVASAAAASSCTFSATTITNGPDATAIAGCSTISGNVVFATGAANPTISLDQVEHIEGDLTYANDNTLSQFSAPKLTEITGAMKFDNTSRLGSIEMGQLEKSGDVTIQGCGALQTVTTGTQYQEAGKVLITNTQLNTLGGFGNLSKINSITISGNNLLADITMNIGTVGAISIGSNEEQNNGLTVTFDNLTRAESIIVNNATTVSFKSLQRSSGNLAFFYNNFESFSLPNLTFAGGLSIQSNNKLKNISFPELKTLNGTMSGGAFQIVNNPNLKSIGGFDQLSECDGAVKFVGAFDNITSLDNIKKVQGAFNVSSTSDIGNTICPQIQKLYNSQVIRGAWTCTGHAASASSSSGGTSTGAGAASSSSSAAAAFLDIPAMPVISAGLGAFLLQFMLSF